MPKASFTKKSVESVQSVFKNQCRRRCPFVRFATVRVLSVLKVRILFFLTKIDKLYGTPNKRDTDIVW